MSNPFGQFPKFWRGIRYNQIDPVQMQNAMDALETLCNISASGLSVNIVPGSGITFSADIAPKVSVGGGTDIDTVVLVGEPDEGHLFELLVRKVKFTDGFQEGEPYWEWVSDDTITATPVFGYTAIDYGQYLWKNLPGTPPEDPLRQPDSNAIYLKLQKNVNGKNLLWYPGGGIMQHCVVRGTYEGNSKEILAQVVRNEQLVGSAMTISVWPGQFSRDYKAFEWLGSSFLPETCVLPAFFVDDTWYLMQYTRTRPVKVSGAYRVGGCTPVERIT